MLALGWLFVDAAMPSTRVRDTTPVPGFEWVEYPERFIRVGPLEPYRGWVGGTFVVLLAAWAIAALAPRLRRAVARPADVALEGRALRVRYRRGWPKERTIALRDVRGAYALDDDQPLVIHLRASGWGGGGALRVRCDDPTGLARRIEQARASAATVPSGMAWSALPWGDTLRWTWAIVGLLALLPAAAIAGGEWIAGAWSTALVTGLVSCLWLAVGWMGSATQTVTVGSDGVRIDRPWRSRFVPLDRIAGVVVRGDGVRVTTSDGEEIRLGADNGAEIAQRIRAAIARHEGAEPVVLGEEQARVLARGERSTAAWREELARMVDGQSYRKESVRIADLEQLLGDGRASPEERVAAALALPRDPTTRLRVEAAAAACADEDTRAALEAAAENEIAEGALARATRRHQARRAP
jgi:hypothetical protein